MALLARQFFVFSSKMGLPKSTINGVLILGSHSLGV